MTHLRAPHTQLPAGAARRLGVVGAIALLLSACGAPPDATTGGVSSGDRSIDRLERQADALRKLQACTLHGSAECQAFAATLRSNCPFEAALCTALSAKLDVDAAKAICDEGSIAECQAACDGGRPYTCVMLSQFYYDGTRVPKDAERADGIVKTACDAGQLDACVERALRLVTTDPGDAATLAMRACASDAPSVPVLGCALWMEALEHGATAMSDDERIAGLHRACALEARGLLAPSRPIHARTATIEYGGGACGRLKDLGLTP